MARRRTYTTRRSKAKPGGRKRIRIPQPPARPVRLLARDALRRELIQPDPEPFILHRRGPRRPLVGEDPLEARAVPEREVRGYLPERILYKAIVDDFHFIEGIDFDFQSALEGGRIELGGIVADFLFFHLRIVIQVQGPTHGTWLRHKKDEEQFDILAELGYTVIEIEEKDIYNADTLSDRLRRVFLTGSGQRSTNEHSRVNSFVIDRLARVVADAERLASILIGP